jgi:hypothetical protein
MSYIVRVRSDPAKDPKHSLDEEGWLDELPVGKVRQIVEVRSVVIPRLRNCEIEPSLRVR